MDDLLIEESRKPKSIFISWLQGKMERKVFQIYELLCKGKTTILLAINRHFEGKHQRYKKKNCTQTSFILRKALLRLFT